MASFQSHCPPLPEGSLPNTRGPVPMKPPPHPLFTPPPLLQVPPSRALLPHLLPLLPALHGSLASWTPLCTSLMNTLLCLLVVLLSWQGATHHYPIGFSQNLRRQVGEGMGNPISNRKAMPGELRPELQLLDSKSSFQFSPLISQTGSQRQ